MFCAFYAIPMRFLTFLTMFYHLENSEIFVVYSHYINTSFKKISRLTLFLFLRYGDLKISNPHNSKSNDWKKVKKFLDVPLIDKKPQKNFQISILKTTREKKSKLKNTFLLISRKIGGVGVQKFRQNFFSIGSTFWHRNRSESFRGQIRPSYPTMPFIQFA